MWIVARHNIHRAPFQMDGASFLKHSTTYIQRFRSLYSLSLMHTIRMRELCQSVTNRLFELNLNSDRLHWKMLFISKKSFGSHFVQFKYKQDFSFRRSWFWLICIMIFIMALSLSFETVDQSIKDDYTYLDIHLEKLFATSRIRHFFFVKIHFKKFYFSSDMMKLHSIHR